MTCVPVEVLSLAQPPWAGYRSQAAAPSLKDAAGMGRPPDLSWYLRYRSLLFGLEVVPSKLQLQPLCTS